ncbi:hypothetical protein CKA81_05165 [Pollutimonas thiosulfatoxidans]|uniref:Uncharacterized protein n=1 Tax=Pollutimonas thiosulfatoxidans TaxID=2028345 RepID=A0A410GAF5_9BURK|nr:hypothetical protein CKA81_05165 [Pollutimonas thiosulfatoxidans]
MLGGVVPSVRPSASESWIALSALAAPSLIESPISPAFCAALSFKATAFSEMVLAACLADSLNSELLDDDGAGVVSGAGVPSGAASGVMDESGVGDVSGAAPGVGADSGAVSGDGDGAGIGAGVVAGASAPGAVVGGALVSSLSEHAASRPIEATIAITAKCVRVFFMEFLSCPKSRDVAC